MVEPADEAESLSLPLRQYVDEDNRQFRDAIDNWNAQPTDSSGEDAAVSARAERSGALLPGGDRGFGRAWW